MSETIDRPAARSERINLLVTREEKRDLEAKARVAGLSVSEFLRRAGERYDPAVDWAELDALAEEFERVTGRLEGKLDGVLGRIEASFARMDDEDALRERAEADIARMGLRWPGPNAGTGA